MKNIRLESIKEDALEMYYTAINSRSTKAMEGIINYLRIEEDKIKRTKSLAICENAIDVINMLNMLEQSLVYQRTGGTK